MIYINQIIAAVIGSLGFALIFNLKRDKIIFALLGAGLGWAVYLICNNFIPSPFIANMAASVFCTASAELLARYRKAPATLFLIVHILPLVPGGSLYYAMRSFVIKDQAAFALHGMNTLYVSAGIAVGILIVTSIIYILNTFIHKNTNT